MATRDILAIGASAGGVEAILYLARNFPPEFPAAVLVTLHLSSQGSTLDDILTRAGPLPARFSNGSDRLEPGRIVIAPPGRHLIVEGDSISLGHGPRENNSRPSIDPMLRSAGVCCGHRAIGVILTGTLGDGASGLWALAQCGGIGVVQEPEDAAFPEMPRTALNRSKPQYVVPLAEMPQLLQSLVRQPAGIPSPAPAGLKFEVEIAKNGQSSMSEMDRIGNRSVLACPDCHGVMWEIDEDELIRYRCHEGHAYTAEVMRLALDENVRRAFASALRALDERVALAERLRKQAAAHNHALIAKHWAAKKREYESESDVIRNAIRQADTLSVKPDSAVG